MARTLLAEAEVLYRELGDERFVARVWLQLGYLALLENDIEHARELVTGGLSIASELGDRWGAAELLDGMAAVFAARGDWRAAAVTAGAAEATWKSLGARAHPADRVSTDRWVLPVLQKGGKAGAAARDKGARLGVDHAVAYALSGAARSRYPAR